MVGFNIKFNPQDVLDMRATIARAQEKLGKSIDDSINWAGYFVARSLAASTREAPRLRPIVRNPALSGKGGKQREKDMRRARFGVWRWDPLTGEKYFQPIYRGGEFGASIKYIAKDRALVKVGFGKWIERSTGTEEFDMAGIAQHKRRKIGRRGLAKKTWTWAQRNTRKGGTASIMGAKDAVSVRWSGGKAFRTLTIVNNLRYMGYALANGKKDVSEAMGRAVSAMRKRIEQALARKTK